MPRHAKKLTKRDLDQLRAEAEADPKCSRMMADAGQPGLYAAARRGRVEFFTRYRTPNGGTRRTMKIDDYGAITLEQARRVALERRAAVARDVDPLEEREAERLASTTVKEAVEGYLADLWARAESGTAKRGKPGGYSAATRLLERYVVGSAIGRRRLRDVTTSDVRRLHKSVSAPTEANRLLTALSAVFGWAIREELLSGENPCRGVERHREDGTRRDLKPDELRRLGAVLREAEEAGGVRLPAKGRSQQAKLHPVHPSVVLAVRLLCLTGFRRSEIVGQAGKDRRGKLEGLRWGDVDLDAGLIHLRDSKAGRQTRVIGAAAVQLLGAAKPARARATDPVCPGGIEGEPYSYGLDKMRVRLWQAAGIPQRDAEGKCDLHSARHSFASIGFHLAGGRYASFVSPLLGHGVQVRQAITARYINENREAMRPAADAIAAEIARLLELGEPADVLRFPASEGGR